MGNMHDSLANGGPGIASADASAPPNRRTIGGEFLDNAGLAPNRVAARPEPLRPVVGKKRLAAKNQRNEKGNVECPNWIHASASSMVWRTAFGESAFSASSR